MINESLHLLLTNLLSPLPLAFLIGMAATLLKSELEFPAPVPYILRCIGFTSTNGMPMS